MWKNILFILSAFGTKYIVLCEIEYNVINDDRSYAFRHSNNDIGSYHHTASGSRDNIVQGRYGSRNPTNGQVEDTVYSAGPQGFRANGPQIHRKMDLTQFPRDPFIDPNNDPNNLPTYSFDFRTPEQERIEDTDRTGRTRGLYSYLDDIGESHTVRYAAGPGTGFRVLNAVPDTAASVAYNAPLYKAPRWTRGKMATELGPNGQYKFILSGPDHRRSESVGSDGITRGSYSYLDDKGIQRTVEYIAGAGIGYRVVQNIVGKGTHLGLKPALPSFGTNNDFVRTGSDTKTSTNLGRRNRFMGNRKSNKSGQGNVTPNLNNLDSTNQSDGSITINPTDGLALDTDRYGTAKTTVTRRPGTELRKNTLTGLSENRRGQGNVQNFNKDVNLDESRTSTGDVTLTGDNDYDNDDDNNDFSSKSEGNTKISTSRNSQTTHTENENVSSHRTLEITSDLDFGQRSRDSTIIKNVGKWYIGLPPGQTVRAHIQNIDLLPYGGRILSPSEALRRDELKKSSSRN